MDTEKRAVALSKEFFPKAFPEFEFHRDSSWKNIIAYGKDRCESVFERKWNEDVR